MLKIRLMRIGGRQRPFYRVVAVDERAKRTGGYVELLGTYNPLTEPKEIKLKQDRIDHWVKQGAQMSDGFLRIIGKAKQRPPRKAKKEKKTEEPSVVSPQTSEEKPAEESKAVEETPVEETTPEAAAPVEEPAPIEEKPVEEETPAETTETVIASEVSEARANTLKQSSSDETPKKIATEPEAPRNDKEESGDNTPLRGR